ncbi:unnamed protein product [Linum tenue]|uniref:D-isomer specific 2-hydroxyacid dehydrogenase catalytic domain-containing protein n=1 Tax=Linum tenue TaxID=586396 RepID=A0AAV0P8L0_9ROSI|nr:unnamed protein product [Linum tenue]
MGSPAADEDLPQVLIIRNPPAFTIDGEEQFTSPKFRFLKAFESTLPPHDFLAARARSVRAMLASGGAVVDARVLQFLPELRLIVTTTAGLNQLDLPECRRRGIRIANAGDVYSADVADCAVGLLIDVLRKISASNRYVKQGFWASKGDYPLGSKVNLTNPSSVSLVAAGMCNSGFDKVEIPGIALLGFFRLFKSTSAAGPGFKYKN